MTSQPAHGNSLTFDKGKFTYDKLKDKHYVDGAVEYVQVAFPDQYGRLWATQVHADFFIKTVEKDGLFTFQNNPFSKDVLGTSIEGLEDMGKSIKLKADLSTLRLSHLHASSAFALADVYSEESEALQFAPRTMLKTQIEKSASLQPAIHLQFSVNYQTNKKDSEEVQPREGIDSGIITSGNQTHLDFAHSVESVLRNSGIPVSHIQQLSPNKLSINIATKEESKQAKGDLLVYADAFHCAKWLIKAKAHASNYEVGFLPQCSSGASNFLKLTVPSLLPLEGDLLRQRILKSRLQLYFPSLNSLRRLAENS